MILYLKLLKMKKYFAEFIGTMVLTLLGCGISGCHINPARSFGPAIFAGGAIAAPVWKCLAGECKCENK